MSLEPIRLHRNCVGGMKPGLRRRHIHTTLMTLPAPHLPYLAPLQAVTQNPVAFLALSYSPSIVYPGPSTASPTFQCLNYSPADYEAVHSGEITSAQACAESNGLFFYTEYQGVTVTCGTCACCTAIDPPPVSTSEVYWWVPLYAAASELDLTMQSDCNLVLTSGGATVWQSGTSSSDGPCTLSMQVGAKDVGGIGTGMGAATGRLVWDRVG